MNYPAPGSSSPAFGLANASSTGNKEAATHSNDLHSILYSTFPEVPSRFAGRQLPSPFLTTHHLDLFENWPQQWGHFFAPGN
jgi:hypothetical protein